MPDMKKVAMPSRAVFNGEADNFYDTNYELNNRMRIPQTLRVSDDFTESDEASTSGSAWTQPIPEEMFEMHMPDRILLAGNDQHVGLRAPPIEMTLENPVTTPEHTLTRVQTPPRLLTLGDHFFPTVDDDHVDDYPNNIDLNASLPLSNRTFSAEAQIVRRAVREQTPVWNSSVLDVSLAPSEEVVHLRRQVGKLNRRVMAVELENLQRQQREKIFYAITIAYFFLKTFNWLTRN